MHNIKSPPQFRKRRPPAAIDRTQFFHYEQPEHAELSADDAAQLRQLLGRLRRRYPLGRRRHAGGKASNRTDALIAGSLMIADPGATIDALCYALDTQYDQVGRGGRAA